MSVTSSDAFLDDYSKFSARDYLNEYFRTIEIDCSTHYEFLVEVFTGLSSVERMLDYGCGPVIFTLFPFIPAVKEIHLVDYSKANLDEIQLWLRSDPDAFDWSHFTKAILEKEGKEPTVEAIAARESLVRQVVTHVGLGDIRQPCPPQMQGNYDIVMCNFCLESVSTTVAEYRTYLDTLLKFLKPQGTLTIACVINSTSYKVGSVYYQTCFLEENSLVNLLIDAGFPKDKITLRSYPFRAQEAEHAPPGGVAFVAASR